MRSKFLKIISILLLFVVTNTYALEIVQAGNSVKHEGDYNSSRFVAGNDVIDTANVDGISFVAGNQVKLNGKTTYGFYAGNDVVVNENIEKDLFVAGNHVSIGSDAVIGRDVYVAGSTVMISANLPRDLKVGAARVDITDITISGDAYVMADEIVLNENTKIEGKLTYSEDSIVRGLEAASIGSVEKVKSSDVAYTYTIKDRIIEFVGSVVAGFIVLLVLFYLIPKARNSADEFELSFDNIAKTAGIGLLVLIGVPIAAVIGLVTGILLPLSFIVLAIYVISIYLSFLLSGYILGSAVMNKLIHNGNMYLSLLLGIVLVKLLSLVPYIGGYVSFIALVFGLGLIYKFIKNIRNNEDNDIKEAVVVEEKPIKKNKKKN